MSDKSRNKPLMRIIYTAVFAALVFVATYLLKVPVGNGYYHLGDAFIYVAAVCLPTSYAMSAAAIGAALADLTGGYVTYIIPTLLIKAAFTLFFTYKGRILCTRNIIAVFAASLVNIAGYYFAEVILGMLIANLSAAQSFTEALITIAGNLSQSAVGAVVFIAAAAVMDTTNLRVRLFRDVFKDKV